MRPLQILAATSFEQGETGKAREAFKRKQSIRIQRPEDRALLHGMAAVLSEAEGREKTWAFLRTTPFAVFNFSLISKGLLERTPDLLTLSSTVICSNGSTISLVARAKRALNDLRKLGYAVSITPPATQTARPSVSCWIPGVGVQPQGDGHEPDAVLLQGPNIVQAVHEGPPEAVQFPDQEAVEFPRAGIGHQPVEVRAAVRPAPHVLVGVNDLPDQTFRAPNSRICSSEFRKLDRTENTGSMGRSQRDVMPTLKGDSSDVTLCYGLAMARAVSPEVSSPMRQLQLGLKYTF